MITKNLFGLEHRFPAVLNEEELHKLFINFRNGDQTAKDKILEHNMRLVFFRVSRRFGQLEYDKHDLISIGTFGLMKAIETFDITKNIKFTTYATRCIDNEILMFIRKLKKTSQEESLDTLIFTNDKDGSERKLSDVLSNGIDIEQDYIDKEITLIIREEVKRLPDRERKIITMTFGFDDSQIYTQAEIAKKLKLSQSYISRVIKKTLKQVGERLKELGIVEKNTTTPVLTERKVASEETDNSETQSIEAENNPNNTKQKLPTIYEDFAQYTHEQINQMLLMLTSEEREMIRLRYGDDLDTAISNETWNRDLSFRYYTYLVPKMKTLLSKIIETNTMVKPVIAVPNNDEKVEEEIMPITINEDQEDDKDEPISELVPISQSSESVSLVNNENTNEVVTNDDYIKSLEIIKTPIFMNLLQMFSPKECVIAVFKLGYLDGKCFSTSAISEFLGVEMQEVIDITKKVLVAYKERMNQIMDEMIQSVDVQQSLNKHQ